MAVDRFRRAYRSDLAHYLASGGQLPADPAAIVAYLRCLRGLLDARRFDSPVNAPTTDGERRGDF
jgi:hypothetical protein